MCNVRMSKFCFDVFLQVEGVQCIGGTGAVALAAHFLGSNHPSKIVYVSDPTWGLHVVGARNNETDRSTGNHHSIFKRAGMTVRTYRYYNSASRSLDFEGFIADLKVVQSNVMFIELNELQSYQAPLKPCDPNY